MQGILDFFDYFSEILNSAFEYFTGFLEDIVLLFKYLGYSLSTVLSLIVSLPVWLQAFAFASVGVCVVFVILGRNSGGQS